MDSVGLVGGVGLCVCCPATGGDPKWEGTVIQSGEGQWPKVGRDSDPKWGGTVAQSGEGQCPKVGRDNEPKWEGTMTQSGEGQ